MAIIMFLHSYHGQCDEIDQRIFCILPNLPNPGWNQRLELEDRNVSQYNLT